MPQVRFDCRSVEPQELRDLSAGLLRAAGLEDEDARVVADSLVEANLRGVDSHGVARLPHYLRRIRHGSINPRPQIRLEVLGPAAARVDGDRGLGQLVMLRAADQAVELARGAGAAWVAVANSSHCGALAHYGLRIAEAGMIGMVFSHVDTMVLPHGSKEPFCGTNPLCITAPRAADGYGDRPTGPLCLDMATSIVPWNTVANAATEGVPIEEGWAVDAEGNGTTDPSAVAFLHPFGAYKGSGLGLLIDVLCAMLSDSPFGPDIPKMYGDLDEPRRLGGLVGAIDVGRFVPLARFHARVDEIVRRWGALTPSEPGGRVLYPGEPELIERHRRLRDGIPVGLRVLDELEALAGGTSLSAAKGVAGIRGDSTTPFVPQGVPPRCQTRSLAGPTVHRET